MPLTRSEVPSPELGILLVAGGSNPGYEYYFNTCMRYLPKNEQRFSTDKQSFEQNITPTVASSESRITATLQQNISRKSGRSENTTKF